MSAQTPPPLPPIVTLGLRVTALRAALKEIAHTPQYRASPVATARTALLVDTSRADSTVSFSPPALFAAMRRLVQKVDDGLLSKYLADEMAEIRAALRDAGEEVTP